MATRYEYKCVICNTGYMETRNEFDPVVNETCVQCQVGKYRLIKEVKLEEE
jgi:hypothetical protein